ncbi:DUF1016 N-terminal domain-containing protein [Lentisphaera profundi]|uniref:DUF1016 N-terminal domain-containing protein n=1 Tax=Lentisphaera profundi TaxID=1658616 RepID=A0ABY7VNX3_9BACT|nr:DUF1016 N-terminal domain-containing protein [Lentisphaera profundi]WDE95642.1 DUF1016 N-terminal domain-containing protein [Lentisphaera profundi]
MDPDLFNLSGLPDPQENAPEEEAISMTDLLDQLYSDVSAMVNNEETDPKSVEVAWFTGEKVRKVLGFIQSSPKAPEALQELTKHLEEITKGKITPENTLDYVRFAETCPDIQIVSRLSEHLQLAHFLTISALDDDMHRVFYSEKCFSEKWTVEALKSAISKKNFESEYE